MSTSAFSIRNGLGIVHLDAPRVVEQIRALHRVAAAHQAEEMPPSSHRVVVTQHRNEARARTSRDWILKRRAAVYNNQVKDGLG